MTATASWWHERRFLGRCKRCKRAVRRECTVEITRHETQRVGLGGVELTPIVRWAYRIDGVREDEGARFFAPCAHCKAAGIVPHLDQAFGPVYAALARQGLIVRTGYAPRRRGHGSPGPVWRLA